MAEFKLQALKDLNRTFELGKFHALSKKSPVVVMDGNKAIMTFDALGKFDEVQVKPLKSSMASLAFYEMDTQDTFNQAARKGHVGFWALLKGFESRGGKL